MKYQCCSALTITRTGILLFNSSCIKGNPYLFVQELIDTYVSSINSSVEQYSGLHLGNNLRGVE